jgi:hypothetical protein
MAHKFVTYLSDRSIPLVFNGEMHESHPAVVTVENYLKWYSLFLVKPDGSVEKIAYDGSIQWADHVPNPSDIETYAEKNGYDIDREAMDMIVGRWVTEIEGREAEFVGKDELSACGRCGGWPNCKPTCSKVIPHPVEAALHAFVNGNADQTSRDIVEKWLNKTQAEG